MLTIFVAGNHTIGLIIPYVSLNITEKMFIDTKTNIFTKTRNQNSFRVCETHRLRVIGSCN
jgi:hypothetical protein